MHAPEWRVGGHVVPAVTAVPPADDRLRSLSCSLSPPSQGGDPLSPLPTSPLFAVPSPASPDENRAAGRPTGLYLERHHQLVYDEGMREAAEEAEAMLLQTRGAAAAALRMVPSSVPYEGGGGEPRATAAAAAAAGKAKGASGYSYASSQLAYDRCEDAASRKSRALRQRQPNVCAGLPPPPRVAKHPETKNAGWSYEHSDGVWWRMLNPAPLRDVRKTRAPVKCPYQRPFRPEDG